MKLFKKAALLCTALLVCLGASTLSACNLADPGTISSDESSASEITSESTVDSSEPDEDEVSSESSSSEESVEEEEPVVTDYAYKVSVQNATGAKFSNMTVRFYDGETEIASKKTNRSGDVTFTEDEIALGTYTVKADIPQGYAYIEDTTTVAQKGQELIVLIQPTGVLPAPEGGVPMDKMYSLGDVMYDFTVQTSDNKTFTLSQVLAEKDMVLLNFWATWCGPCLAEFPAMTSSYELYKEDIAILAVSTTDAKNAVSTFKSSNGISFDMAHDQGQLSSKFNTSSIPVSIIIDRYGVVAYMHTGNMVNVNDFTGLYDFFVGDDYQPTILSTYDGSSPGVDGGEDDRIKPNVPAPSLADVKNVFSPDTNFQFAWDTDTMSAEELEYSWPWTITNDEYGMKFLHSSNAPHASSYAQLFGTFTTKAGDVLCFDYKLNTEAKADILYVVIDGVIAQQLSGYSQGWQTCYAYVFEEHMAGQHSIAFIYMRDSEGGSSDGVQLKNLRFADMSELADMEMDYVYRQGGEVLNPEGSATQFKYYVTPVLNEDDGYYHVGTKDGPILFANIMNVSAWNDVSVWLLAYNDYVIQDGINYKSAIESYAWEANNNLTHYGYTPVTEELRFLLDIVVKNVKDYRVWKGEYHENEWLELCSYYSHYGATEPFEDPMKTITFNAAEEIFEGRNTVNVPFAMNPRGFKYKFIPTTSGVYHFSSTECIDPSTGLPYETATDPECWLMQLDEFGNEIFLGYYTDLVYAEVDASGAINGHFSFHYALEAGQTYYLLCTTFLDTVATYDVIIENIGNSYTYMENAAVGPYSFNEVTGELFIPSAINFAYSEEDGYYHYVDEFGNLGSIIYLDLKRTTALLSSSLYDIAYDAYRYEVEKRFLYINGVDYTEYVLDLCFSSNMYQSYFMAVDQEIYDFLMTLTTSSKVDGTFNAWLMLCYYEKTISI